MVCVATLSSSGTLSGRWTIGAISGPRSPHIHPIPTYSTRDMADLPVAAIQVSPSDSVTMRSPPASNLSLGSVAMVDSEYKVDTERQHTSATLRDVQEQLKSATSQVPSAEANVRKSRSSTDKGITTPSSNLTDARTTLTSLIHSAVAKGREDLSADLTVVATPDGLGSCTHLHGLLA